MIPSRRQFVAAIAAIPLLPRAGASQPQSSAATIDPVLDGIAAELRRLSDEFDNAPRSRKATMRAIESALEIGAVHLAAHYDPGSQRALRRQRTRRGRPGLVQELMSQAHAAGNFVVTHESLDAALSRLERRGLSGCFRDAQQALRTIRLQAPDAVFLAGLPSGAQFDYCSDLRWMIEINEAAAAIACGIALLEPTPAGEAACGALMLNLGLLYAQRLFWC
jgi:hypothetical protein